MGNPSNSQYLESKILIASQPHLHLMLLVGAVRFGRKALELWESGADFAEVETQIDHVAAIVEELTNSVVAGEQQIAKQLEEQYSFLFRELAACRINRDVEKLKTCLNLLEYDRDTWKLACGRVESEPTTTSKPARAVPRMHFPTTSIDTLSLEA
jgi:flagellar biosynthetic protein FliS